MARFLVVGAGVFGVTAALELRGRGHDVTLVDPGPVPHPLAESTDISKAVRMDYGADAFYTAHMERALDGWRRWNTERTCAGEGALFHETGVVYLSRGPMREGAFEHDSFATLSARGHAPVRLGPAEIRRRFPAWNHAVYTDGYWNPQGGWAESGRVVAWLAAKARDAGVAIREGFRCARLLDGPGATVTGVVDAVGEEVRADHVVVCAGAWTRSLLPWLADCFREAAQPVFHLAPEDPAPFEARVFPTFGADIASTGYYGFPLHPARGVVKIANHGPGRELHPDRPRAVTNEDVAALRAFLAATFPGLATAPIVETRVCTYGDTWDEHFWIARDHTRERLTVAAGGSGHAFKFAPLLGGWIADAALGRGNPELRRFRARPEVRPSRGEEAARHHGGSAPIAAPLPVEIAVDEIAWGFVAGTLPPPAHGGDPRWVLVAAPELEDRAVQFCRLRVRVEASATPVTLFVLSAVVAPADEAVRGAIRRALLADCPTGHVLTLRAEGAAYVEVEPIPGVQAEVVAGVVAVMKAAGTLDDELVRFEIEVGAKVFRVQVRHEDRWRAAAVLG